MKKSILLLATNLLIMDEQEIDSMLALAEAEDMPLPVRQEVTEKLVGLNGSLDLSAKHRLEKVQHALRRQVSLAMRAK